MEPRLPRKGKLASHSTMNDRITDNFRLYWPYFQFLSLFQKIEISDIILTKFNF